MNRKIFLFKSCLVFIVTAHAQDKGIVQGKVVDAGDKKAQAGATISLTNQKDSTNNQKIVTNSEGWFRLTNIPLGDSLVLKISSNGHQDFLGILFIRQKRLTLADIQLEPASTLLDEVVIKSITTLAVIKGDTTEFRASSFTTLPNAMARDLVKRISGLFIDANGKLFFNGRPVTKILVDGKEFFGTDGGVALKNIPVDLIDKIQLFDAKTVVEEMTGSKASGDGKVLNIKMKPGRKFFGNSTAAAGTDNRYDVSGFGNYIYEKERIAVTGGRNNVSGTGMGSEGMATAITGGGGITRNLFAGIDYNRDLKGTANLSANYKLVNPATFRESVQQRRQNIVSDSIINTYSTGDYNYNSMEHSLQVTVRDQNKYILTGSMQTGSLDNLSLERGQTKGSSGSQLNDLANQYHSIGKSLSCGLDFCSWVPMKKGRILILNGSISNSCQQSKDESGSLINFYKSNVVDSSSLLIQSINNSSGSLNLRAGVQYDGLISKTWRLLISYNFSDQVSHADKTTWRLDSAGKRVGIDSIYSNSFHSCMLDNTAEISVEHEGRNWSLSTQLNLLSLSREQKDYTRNQTVRNAQFNISPAAIINYGNPQKKFGEIRLILQMTPQKPTLEQLQPVSDNANPLYLLIGNPNLRTSITSLIGLSCMRQVVPKNLTISVGVTSSPVSDKIIAAIRYDSLGKHTSQFRNINGTYSLRGDAMVSKRFKTGPHVIQVSVISQGNYAEDKVYLNGILAKQISLSLNPTVSVQYNKADGIEADVRYSPSFNRIHCRQNKAQDLDYTIQNIQVSAGFYAFKRLKFRNEISYRYIINAQPVGFNKTSMLWNMQLSYLCLKSRKVEVKITGFDMLKQNHNLIRTVGANYIQDSQTNNLQQYFLLGFVYNFSVLKE